MSASEESKSPVMRAEEVCRILDIGRNTFYEWCRLNLIPHKRVGRLIMVSRKRFYDWLENNNEGGMQ